MKNKRKLMAFTLAAVMVCSQMSVMGSSVTAEETELSTETVTEASPDPETEDTESETLSVSESETSAQSETEASTESESGTESTEEAADETEESLSLSLGSSLAGLDESGVSVASEDGGDETEGTGDESGTEGEEENYEDSWWLNAYWSQNSGEMLVGDTLEITYTLGHDYYDADNDSWEYEEITDFTLEYEAASRYIDCEVTGTENGQVLTITAKREGGTTVYLDAYGGDGDWVAEDELGISVTDGYYILEFVGELDTVALGETLQLDSTDFELTHYYTVDSVNYSDTVAIDDDEFRLYLNYYDGDYWKDVEEGHETSVISLTRIIANYGTDIEVYAEQWNEEDQCYYNISSCWIGFDGLGYSVDAEYNYSREDFNYVFDTDALTISLIQAEDSENDLPEGYTVEWYMDEDRDSASYVTLAGTEDGSCTISVTDAPEDYYEGEIIRVWAELYYEDNWIADWGADIEVLVEYVQYEENHGDETLALGEGTYVESYMNYYYRNMDNPYGGDGTVAVTDVSIAYEELWDEEAEGSVIGIEPDSEYGWNIYSENFGYAIVQVTYQTVEGNEAYFLFDLTVTDEYYYLEWSYPENTDQLQIGGELTIDVAMTHVYVNENGDVDYATVEFSDDSYQLTADWDQSIVDVSVSGGQVVITGVSYDGTDVWLYAWNGDPDSEDTALLCESSIHANVTSDTYYSITAAADNIGIGESVDLSALEYVLTEYVTDEEDNASSEILTVDGETYRLRLDTDTVNWDNWKYAEGSSEEDLLPVLIRTNNYWTDFRIIADKWNEEDECWDEWVCDTWIGFDYIDYSVYLTATYGDTQTWYLYAGEPVTITLSEYENEFALPDDCVVVWEYEAWQYDDETGEDVQLSDDAVTVASADESGRVITMSTDEENVSVYYGAIVYYEDNEITQDWSDLWTMASTVYAYAYPDEWNLLPGEDTEMHVYLQEFSPTYPNGNTTEGEIVGIEVVDAEQWTEDGTHYPAEEDVAEFDGSTVRAMADGCFTYAVTYVGLDGEEYVFNSGDYDDWIYVMSDFYYLNLEDVYTTYVGETISVPVDLIHAYVDETPVRESAEYSSLNLFSDYTYDEETGEYVLYTTFEDDGISIELDESGKTLIIDGLRETCAWVCIDVLDEDGIEMTWTHDFTVVVLPARTEAEITGETEYEVTYGDDDFNLNMETTSDGELKYEVTEGADVVSVDEEGTVSIIGVGTATIRVYVEGTDTYFETEVEITVNADKADAAITADSTDVKVAYAPSAGFYLSDLGLNIDLTGNGTLVYALTSGEDVISLDTENLYATVMKAGTATITVSADATELYNAADSITINVTVSKAAGTASVSISSWAAGDTASTPVPISETNGTENVTYSYKVKDADDSTYTATASTTAGSYTIKAVFAETDNYNEVTATADFMILDGYVESDAVVTDLADISLPEGWTWSEDNASLVSGAVNTVTAKNAEGETVTLTVALIPTANDTTFTKGADTEAVITCTGALAQFVSVAVDGVELTEDEDYTAESGSTILRFSEAYLNTLAEGDHDVQLTYQAGTVAATLGVVAQAVSGETESESETEATTEPVTETESESEAVTESETETESESEAVTESESEATTEAVTESETEAATETESETTATEAATETTASTSTESETESETSSSSVSTGDNSPIEIYIAVMLLAVSVMMAGAIYRRLGGKTR